MNSKDLLKDIREEYIKIYTELYKKHYIKEHNGLSEKKISNNGYEISWSGKNSNSNITFNLKKDMDEIISELLDKGQYSLLFYDRSILLVEYIIEGDSITKQRLQYLNKSSNIKKYEEVILMEEGDKISPVEPPDWFIEEKGIPFYIRADYDPTNHVDIIHAESHLTISNLKNCRIPLKSNINLSKFTLFILRHVYGDYEINLGKGINNIKTISSKETGNFHLSWEREKIYEI